MGAAPWYPCSGLVIFRLDCLGLCAIPARLSAEVATSKVSLNQDSRFSAGAWLFFLNRRCSPVTKLYVGNLPFTATEEAVRAIFSPHGTVEKLALITDRDSGRPRGFGFVEMSNTDASRAMQALNGTDFDGRTLRINEAQERDRGGGNDRGGPRRY